MNDDFYHVGVMSIKCVNILFDRGLRSFWFRIKDTFQFQKERISRTWKHLKKSSRKPSTRYTPCAKRTPNGTELTIGDGSMI